METPANPTAKPPPCAPPGATGHPPCLHSGPLEFLVCPTDTASEKVWGTTLSANVRGDSGVDLRAPVDVVVDAHTACLLDFRVKAACVCKVCGAAWAFMLAPRSSLGTKTPLIQTNGVGFIDAGYRGALKVPVLNLGGSPFSIKTGTAYFQLLAHDLRPMSGRLADEHEKNRFFSAGATARGAGGFGSTGPGGQQ
jgi:dUTP pyrophosphatase